jgi:hypothetical protein
LDDPVEMEEVEEVVSAGDAMATEPAAGEAESSCGAGSGLFG